MNVDPFSHQHRAYADPFDVPTLVGCVIAVSKKFFQKIGGFDTDMDLWGGENFEIAFRAWMCGGKVITQPCSRVGHLYRPLPYLNEHTKQQIPRNLARIAEIWMDKYKHFFYASQSVPLKLTPEDYASIGKRRAMKEQLQCKSFRWYMETVIPEVPSPRADATLYGHILNKQFRDGCLGLDPEGGLKLFDFCNEHILVPYLLFALTQRRELFHVYRDTCIFVDTTNHKPFTDDCQQNPAHTGHWLVRFPYSRENTLGQVIFLKKGYKACLTLTMPQPHPDHTAQPLVQMLPCLTYMHPSQLWTWTYKFTNFHPSKRKLYRSIT